jgi:DNA-binding transcriptional ArsR family regulator
MNPDAGQLIAAMNHPLRRRILRYLRRDRTVSAARLSRSLNVPLGNVCYHVKILAELEVLQLVSMRRVRGARESFYRPSLDGQADWVWKALEACQGRDDQPSD